MISPRLTANICAMQGLPILVEQTTHLPLNPSKEWCRTALGAVLLLCWSAFDGNAQVTFNLSDQVAVAYRVDTPPAIDGALNDVAWRTDASATQFTQNRPFPRSAPTHRTEVWIAYDDDNLYIGAQMHDTAPDSILQQLSVRDRVDNSDEFGIWFSPYNDGINSVGFSTTPRVR